MNRMHRALIVCAIAGLFSATAAPRPATAGAVADRISIGSVNVAIPPQYQCPTPTEVQLFNKVRPEAMAWFESTKGANAQLRRIRECEKGVDEAKSDSDRKKWQTQLEEALRDTSPGYQAYVGAERNLAAAVQRVLDKMSPRERALEPLFASIVHVIPYMYIRENTTPTSQEILDDYRQTYSTNRRTTPLGPGEWQGLPTGQDPTFEEYCRLLDQTEKAKGFTPGQLHSIAWRESLGNPQEGASNANESGLFQVQSTDYQPFFDIPMGEPAMSRWNEYEKISKWVPFNLSVKVHSLERLFKQAESFGFKGADRDLLAYRFYNESSGYVIFSQVRLEYYKMTLGLGPNDLSSTDIPTLDRFIYFKPEEIMQQYDFKLPDGRIAGQALWDAWLNAEFEITSDLLWKVLQFRLTEGPQDYTLKEDASGKKWCKVNLTRQNVKRRGSVGIPGVHMAAISICAARGVAPTAQLFHEYFKTP